MTAQEKPASDSPPGLRFMFVYPEAHGAERDLLDSGEIGELAAALEHAGWHGMAFTEHPAPSARWLSAGGHQTLDPFVALGGVATVTKHLRLLTYLVVLPYRNPMLVAKAATTVDRLSGGRFLLGVGAGYLKPEFAALGVDFAERNALFDEALDVLSLHWSGESFSYRGRHFEARDVRALPRPVQDPIPIWIGGNSSQTRYRVAQRCQGWMPLVGPDELYRTARTAKLGTLAQIGARIREIEESAAGRAVKLDFALAYGDPTLRSPRAETERHRAALGALAEAGVTWIIVSRPMGAPGDIREFVQEFGETYIRQRAETRGSPTSR